METSISSFQEQIFDTLLEYFPKSVLVEIMCSQLQWSKASCYNYINGNTGISFDQMSAFLEIPQIAEVMRKEAQINPGIIKWNYPPFIHNMDTQSYVNGLLSYLRLIDTANSNLVMTTYEIPIFYYMYFPTLFAFKLFCWSKTIWMESEFEADKFDADTILSPLLISQIQELCDRYNTIPAVEYWTTNMMNNTVRQILYFRDTDKFKNINQIKNLTQNLYDLTDLLKEMAKKGQKLLSDKISPGAQSRISQNDIYYTNNIFLVENNNLSYVFSSFDNPNYIFSNDHRIIDKTLRWIKNMDNHCISLTNTNEIVRNDFFNQLTLSIEALEF